MKHIFYQGSDEVSSGHHPQRRTTGRGLLLVLGLVLLGLAAAGCGGAPQHAIKLQFLDKASLDRVKFLDLAVFSESIACSDINHTNYRSSEKKISDARLTHTDRGVEIIPVLLDDGLKGTDSSGASQYSAWIDKIGGAELKNAGEKGLKVRMYVLALGTNSAGTEKENIAQGCADVTLVYQKNVDATITLAKIP